MGQLSFKHQREKVTADCAGPRQSVFRPEDDFCAETENFPINRSADYSRNILVFCNKSSGHNDIKTWFSSPLRYPFAGPVNLASPHERACSAINARASRASRFRCLRNNAPSLDSLFRPRSLSAYWRSAARTRAVRLLRLDEDSASSSRSFEVASSMAIFFIPAIIAAVSDCAQGLVFSPGTRTRKKDSRMHKKIIGLALSAMLFALCASASAQQPTKVARIGYLVGPSSASSARYEAFRQGLRDLGYVEGKNIVIEWRSSEGNRDRQRALVAELVRLLKVDVIVAVGAGDIRIAKEATATIPIVMIQGGDPVGSGFVASLARPGANITGLATLRPELSGKRLELLKETVPRLSRVALFASSASPDQAQVLKEAELAAGALGVKLQSLDIRSPKDFETSFQAALKGRAEAILVRVRGPILSPHRKEFAELAVKNRLPVIYEAAEEAGGLMSYGVNFPDLYRRAAIYVDKILKGRKPADLPAEQPTKVEFIINLKAAKQIGLTIPPNVLARADRVIR
jgi:putative tryptophan/tyrosine transport system substrate-binding protein